MRKSTIVPLVVSGLTVIGLAIWFFTKPQALASDQRQDRRSDRAVPVRTVAIATEAVSVNLSAVGTVEARQSVAVRAEVGGTLKSIHFREGDLVKAGQLLFRIDAGAQQAEVERALANVARDQAALDEARTQVRRLEPLHAKGYVTQQEYAQAAAQERAAQATVRASQAALKTMQLQLDHAGIRAPIPGHTGMISLHPGGLVQPGSTVLVNIAQIDRVNVSFTLPERQFAEVQQAFVKGKVPVSVQTDAGQAPVKGHLVFVDNTVDSASGSIRLKAEFPNGDQRLWPGMSVAVSLKPRVLTDALTVPVQAVQTGPEQKFVYTVGAENKVSTVPIKVALIQDGIAVIDGVGAGTRVVVEGAQNLRPGSAVTEQRGQETGAGKRRGGKAGPDGSNQ